MKRQAVITGDITHFTKLPPADRQDLVREAGKLLASWLTSNENAEFFRGDSYQVLFETPSRAIWKSLQLICWFKMQDPEPKPVGLNTRISIGTGGVSYQGKNVLNSDGQAFHLSGRNFDGLNKDTYLSITTPVENKNKAIKIILSFVNKYVDKWTRAQAEVIFLQLQGNNQDAIAKALAITQPSVNSRLKAAGWREIEPALNYLIHLTE